jgi:hypothetical protein
METCPKIASPRPPVEGRQPPRLATEADKFPIRGLIALIALLAHLKLALLRLFTIPPVSHRDLVLLVRFVRTFLQTPLEARVPRDKHFKETDLHCLVLCLLVV